MFWKITKRISHDRFFKRISNNNHKLKVIIGKVIALKVSNSSFILNINCYSYIIDNVL